MAKTSIEWAEETWNPVAGCTIKSTECANCYAMKMAARLEAMGQKKYVGLTRKVGGNVVWTGEVRFDEDALQIPLKQKRPTTYFVDSMSDLFHEGLSITHQTDIFEVMAKCPQHTFQVLTKRAENLYRLKDIGVGVAYRLGQQNTPNFWPLRNVHLGVSVGNQEFADERREYFKAPPAAVKFVSYEPALGPVDWSGWEFVNQIISGGESGQGARPSEVDWHRSTRDWCKENNVAYLFKQWGAFRPVTERDSWAKIRRLDRTGGVIWDRGLPEMIRETKKKAGRLLDGREHNEMPAVRL